jgi:hypothetical protein
MVTLSLRTPTRIFGNLLRERRPIGQLLSLTNGAPHRADQSRQTTRKVAHAELRNGPMCVDRPLLQAKTNKEDVRPFSVPSYRIAIVADKVRRSKLTQYMY